MSKSLSFSWISASSARMTTLANYETIIVEFLLNYYSYINWIRCLTWTTTSGFFSEQSRRFSGSSSPGARKPYTSVSISISQNKLHEQKQLYTNLLQQFPNYVETLSPHKWASAQRNTRLTPRTFVLIVYFLRSNCIEFWNQAKPIFRFDNNLCKNRV